MRPLPFDAIVEGDIMDSNAVATAIRQVLAEQRIKARDVAISVAGQQVMVKKVTFPLMSPAELAESVRWEAESFFPAGQGLDAYALDFAVLEERPADGNMDVVLVACRKDKIEAYLSCVAMAGAKPVLVDVDVFAIQNLYEIGAGEGARDEVVALVNIGAQFTNLTMLVGRKSLFWRDIAWGGHRFTDKLMEDWGISREAAEQLKEGVAAEGRSPRTWNLPFPPFPTASRTNWDGPSTSSGPASRWTAWTGCSFRRQRQDRPPARYPGRTPAGAGGSAGSVPCRRTG